MLVLWVLSAINLGFFLAHLMLDLFHEGGVHSLFDLDKEGNLPSWYSSSQLLVAGLFVGAFVVRNIYKSGIWIVALLAVACLAMSVDEAAGLHERVGDWSDSMIVARETMVMAKTGIWMFLVGVPFVIAIVPGLLKLGRVLADCEGAAGRFVVDFVVLLIGAVGIEILSNFVTPATPLATLQVATEEFVEMMGGSIVLHALSHTLDDRGRMERLVSAAGGAAFDRGRPVVAHPDRPLPVPAELKSL